MKVVVIHGREFKCSEQIKHSFTEFGVATYPAYGTGLGIEDDDGAEHGYGSNLAVSLTSVSRL